MDDYIKKLVDRYHAKPEGGAKARLKERIWRLAAESGKDPRSVLKPRPKLSIVKDSSSKIDKSAGLNQRRIDAVSSVRKAKRLNEVLGHGGEMKVLDAGDKAVKMPTDAYTPVDPEFRRRIARDRTKRNKALGDSVAETTYVQTDKTPYMVQDKVDMIDLNSRQQVDKIMDDIRHLSYDIREKGYRAYDLNPINSGYDPTGKLKSIDTGEFERVDRLPELPDEYIDDISVTKKTAGKFRRVLPVIGPILGLFSDSADAAIDPVGSDTVYTDKAIEDPSSPEFKKRRSLWDSLEGK